MPAPVSPESPGISLLEQFETATPETARERIRSFTARQLEALIREIEASRDVPSIFYEAMIKETIDQRLAEEGQTLEETRNRWQALRNRIERPPAPHDTPETLEQRERRYFFDTALDRVLPANWSQNRKRAVAGLTLGAAAILGWLLMRGDKGKEAAQESGGGLFKKLLYAALGFAGLYGLYKGATSLGWLKGVGKEVDDHDARELKDHAADRARELKDRARGSAESPKTENMRQTALLTGLIWMNPTRAQEADIAGNEAAQHAVLSLIGHADIREKITIGDLHRVNGADDAAALFGGTSISPSSEQLKALHFIALVCRDHEADVRERMRQDGFEEDVAQLPVGTFFSYIGQVSRGLGRLKSTLEKISLSDLTPDLIKQSLLNPKEIVADMQEDISFIRELSEHIPGLEDKGIEFVAFCFANPIKMKDLSITAIPNHQEYDQEELKAFVDALQYIRAEIEEAKPLLLRFGQRNQKYSEKIEEYLKDNLTLFDALQIYSYLHAMRREDGSLPETINEASAMPAMMMQLKAISMVGDKDEYLGKKMTTDILAKTPAMDLDLPDKAKEVMARAGTSIATFGLEYIKNKAIDLGQWGVAGVGSAFDKYPIATSTIIGIGGIQAYREIGVWWNRRLLMALSSPSRLGTWTGQIMYGVKDATVLSKMQAYAAGQLGRAQYGRLGNRLFAPRTLKAVQNKVKEIAQEDPHVRMRTIERTLSADLENLHLNRARFEQGIQSGMSKYPGLSREAFLKNTSEGKDILKELKDVNKKITARTKQYRPDVVEAVSKRQTRDFAQLSVADKQAVRNILKSGGDRVTIRGMTRGMVRATGKRILIMAPLITLNVLTGQEKSGGEELTGELASVGLSLVPVYGTYLDFKAAVTGKDAYTGHDVNRLAALGWGIVGAGTDILTVFTLGAGWGVRAAAAGAKGGIRGSKAALKIVSKADDIARAAKASRKIKYGMGAGYAAAAAGTMYGTFFQEVDSIPDEE